METSVPLVVDLDGSYLKTDTLQELLMLSIRRPTLFVRAAFAAIRHGKAAAKEILASSLNLDVATLPVNPEVRALVERAHADGQEVILATGANQRIANAVRASEPAFYRVLASDATNNFTGQTKAAALDAEFGTGGYDYVGNSSTDLPVWAGARKSYLATTSAGIPRNLRGQSFDEVLNGGGRRPVRAWVKTVRPHQSLKNVLLFLPLIAAHELGNITDWARAATGFVVFSLMASSVYLLNDALDLASDRVHVKKRRRPIAAGDVLPLHAMLAAAAIAAIALVAGSLLGNAFFLVLCVYTVTTIAYSFWLKRFSLVDVLLLAMLYMVRIAAGAALTGISLSFWFIAVTTFLFLSLAFAKRFAEVIASGHSKVRIPGRGYLTADSLVLAALGIGVGVAAVIFLATYIQSADVQLLYRSPRLLWLVIPLIFYWIANVWMVAGRGEMHDDPVVFALKNRASQVSAIIILFVFVLATIAPFAH